MVMLTKSNLIILFVFCFSDVVTDGVFRWSHGEPISYNNWNANMPKDTSGQDDCGNMYTGESSLG